MFCKNCGNELKNKENICSKCGYEVSTGMIKNNVNKQKQQCKSCVRDITDEEYNEYHGYCRRCYEEFQRNKKNDNKGNNVKTFNVILKIAVYIVAIIVVYMFFDGAEGIRNAARNMSNLRSVSGETIAEAYYQYYGKFLYGLETVIQALGIGLGVIIAYIAKKIDIYERNK